jgi:hypothetical protein
MSMRSKAGDVPRFGEYTLFVLAGILLLSMGVAGYGSGLASCGMDVDTVGLTGFLVTMAMVMAREDEAGQWWDVVCPRMAGCSCSCQAGVSCAQLT